VKFSGDGGRVVISAHIENSGDCLLAVADNGIGMPRDQLEKVVEPFQQADSRLARKYEGVGLGLSVAAGLMQLHGGTLQIESASNVGTTVTLRIPAARVLSEPGHVTTQPANDSDSRTTTATIHRLTPRAAAAPRV
jgi:signal transduction histidine kinase